MSKSFRKSFYNSTLHENNDRSDEEVVDHLSKINEKLKKAELRHSEKLEQYYPKTLYYRDESDNLINKVEETLSQARLQEKKDIEKSIVKNWNKVKLIEKHKKRKEENKFSIRQRKVSREEKFQQVQQKQHQIQKQYDRTCRQKLSKYDDKQKKIEQQKNIMQEEGEKRKKLNLFKHLDQQDNLNREKTFFKKFTERVLGKHENVQQSIDRKRQKEKEYLETIRREEEKLKKNGPLLVTNHLDSYYESKKKKAKSRVEKERLKSLKGSSGFELLKILPKIANSNQNGSGS